MKIRMLFLTLFLSPLSTLAQTCFQATTHVPRGLPTVVCAGDLQHSQGRAHILATSSVKQFPAKLSIQKITPLDAKSFQFMATASWLELKEDDCGYALSSTVTVQGLVKNGKAFPKTFTVRAVTSNNRCQERVEESLIEYHLQEPNSLL